MKLQKTTAAWIVTGALGITTFSGAAVAFAESQTSLSSTGLAATAVVGEQVTAQAAPNAVTAPSTATANTANTAPTTASAATANTPASPVSANTPNSPVSPASANTPNSPVSPNTPASPNTPNSPASAPSADSGN